MWKAPEQVRLRRASAWLRREVPRIWGVEADAVPSKADPRLGLGARGLDDPAQRARYERAIAGLGAEFGDEAPARLVPELLCFPAEAGMWPDTKEPNPAAHQLGGLVYTLLKRWVLENPGDYAIGLIGGRLRHLVSNGFQAAEIDLSLRWGHQVPFLEPDVSSCGRLLQDLIEHPATLPIVQELIGGEWDRPLVVPDAVLAGLQPHALEEWKENRIGKGSYRHFGAHLGGLFWRGLSLLADRDALDYDSLRSLAARTTAALPPYIAAYDYEPRYPGEDVVREHVLRLLWEATERLGLHDLEIASRFLGKPLRGGRWLLRAAEQVEARGPEVLEDSSYAGIGSVLRFLAGIQALAADETVEGLAVPLRARSPATLEALLPWAAAGQEAVLLALGWEASIPLLRVVNGIAHRGPAKPYPSVPDVPNSPDPESGRVDRAEIAAVLDAVGDARAKALIAAFRRAKAPPQSTLTLVEAVRGWNRTRVEKGLRQLGQINLKALGLLPLEGGQAEAVERYKTFRQAARDCRRYGSERQANTLGAVAAGIANLAQTAGYDDAGRFEWAMEVEIAEAGDAWSARVGDYETRLELEGLTPRISVSRGDRTLARVPSAVSRTAAYKELKRVATEARAQVSRFRTSLEQAMVEERPLPILDPLRLSRLPALERLLGGLVLSSGEAVGTFEDGRLRGLDGERRPLGDVTTIPHPFRLRAAGALADWQREVVRRRVRQPFKQVFREVYSATDAEKPAEASARFAGHRLEARVVGRLLQSRGWEVATEEGAAPFRRFRAAGLRAWLDLPDAGHYLGEDTHVTTGELRFTRHDPKAPPWSHSRRVPLGRVPPILLSEAMRDADLVVSVAHAGEGGLSDEAYERRAEAVTLLAEALGAVAVPRDGHYVKVEGTLAAYRIHLGSATVLVEPAGAVCILPEAPPAKDPYLPFAEEDERLAEVVSKVLLLARDDEIRDAALLDQIREATRS